MLRETHAIAASGGDLLAYRVRPAAMPVATILFVHGRTFAAVPDFDLQVPGAAQTHSFMEYLAARGVDCWCFDHRGFGRSWKPAEGTPLTATTRSEDLLAVLPFVRARARGPFTIAGLSLGCAAAALALRTWPAACDRLVLLGPSRWRTLTGLRAKLNWLWTRVKFARRRSVYIHVRPQSAEARLWKGEEHRIDRAAFEQFVAQAIAADPAGPADRIRALVSNVFPYDFWDPVIRVPVLAIRGGDDELATPADIEAVRRFVPAGMLKVRIFPGRKHDLHIYTQRNDVFDCIDEFVRAPIVPAAHPAALPAGEHAFPFEGMESTQSP
jgi:alpha-beta hydrolase superfamily lysophospholipase